MGRTKPQTRAEPAGSRFLTGGVDVGCTSIKAALFVHSFRGVEPLAANMTVVRGLGEPGDHRRALRVAWADVLAAAGVSDADVAYVASTGMRDQVAFRVGHYFGRVSQATGTRFLFPQACGFIDGGAEQIRCAAIDEQGRAVRQLVRRWDKDLAVSVPSVVSMLSSLNVAGSMVLIGGRLRDRDGAALLREGLAIENPAIRVITSGEATFAAAYGAALLAARRFQRLSRPAGWAVPLREELRDSRDLVRRLN